MRRFSCRRGCSDGARLPFGGVEGSVGIGRSWVLMIGPYATGTGELRQDRKVAAVSHASWVP